VRGDFSHIWAINHAAWPVTLQCHTKLGYLEEVGDPGAYYAYSADADADDESVQRDIADLATTRPLNQQPPKFTPSSEGPTMKLDNGITVYGEPDVACCLQAVAEEFPEVWMNTDLINILEDKWMRICLKPGWEN
jgi:hypothetical protein